MGPHSGQAGQAQVELIAAIPAAALVVGLILQLFAVGYSQSLADGSAEAGAYAVAAGAPAEEAARNALPGWAAEDAEIETDGGRILVRLPSPSLLGEIGERLTVESTAWARPGAGGG